MVNIPTYLGPERREDDIRRLSTEYLGRIMGELLSLPTRC